MIGWGNSHIIFERNPCFIYDLSITFIIQPWGVEFEWFASFYVPPFSSKKSRWWLEEPPIPIYCWNRGILLTKVLAKRNFVLQISVAWFLRFSIRIFHNVHFCIVDVSSQYHDPSSGKTCYGEREKKGINRVNLERERREPTNVSIWEKHKLMITRVNILCYIIFIFYFLFLISW